MLPTVGSNSGSSNYGQGPVQLSSAVIPMGSGMQNRTIQKLDDARQAPTSGFLLPAPMYSEKNRLDEARQVPTSGFLLPASMHELVW